LSYYPGICLKVLRKVMKNIIQDSQCQSRDLDCSFLKHKLEELLLEPTCSSYCLLL
jgi:hypothetical protein